MLVVVAIVGLSYYAVWTCYVPKIRDSSAGTAFLAGAGEVHCGHETIDLPLAAAPQKALKEATAIGTSFAGYTIHSLSC